MNTCHNCNQSFQITDEHRAFYKKIQVPEPTLCPSCRAQRRFAFRNERTLYRRNCDLCQKSIVAIFDSDVKFPVYCLECWWSDKWDPFAYGQDFDFNKPFFEQYDKLLQKVPKGASLQLSNENSEYNTFLAYSKNTYMSPGGYLMENCMYVRKSQGCRECIDSNSLNKCELVANSTNCDMCYMSNCLINCKNCSFSSYISDSSSLKNCFMCCGLQNKQYHFKNAPYSKEDYEKILQQYAGKTESELNDEFREFSKTVPKKAQIQINCENCRGDYLYNSHNAIHCFDCFDVEDSEYLTECAGVKDSMDMTTHDKEIELCYEMCSGGERNFNSKFCFCTVGSPQSEYMYSCFGAADSFGCDGIHSKVQYCIFNKQYPKEQYEKLRADIISHMRKTGEYGEFFPISIAPSAYNETMAQDYFPLDEATARAHGYKWKAKDLKEYASSTYQIPLKIDQVHDDITQQTLACATCGKNYRIIKQELDLYRKLQMLPSKYCGECRYQNLIKLKNPRMLWTRNCAQCSAEIETTYAPDRPEKVLCEKCYLENTY